jgi:hypothetical protein
MNRIRIKLERNQSPAWKWESFGVHRDLGTSRDRQCKEERKRRRKTLLYEEECAQRKFDRPDIDRDVLEIEIKYWCARRKDETKM